MMMIQMMVEQLMIMQMKIIDTAIKSIDKINYLNPQPHENKILRSA